jgi:hypothetical protein
MSVKRPLPRSGNRAREFFAAAGIEVKAVMTDNGSCYRSKVFAALGDGVKHRRTRPYRPQTNGKVERFNRTLAAEWAHAQLYLSDEHRAATYTDWLHHYNHHRPHTGIAGLTPAQRVHNLTGNYTLGPFSHGRQMQGRYPLRRTATMPGTPSLAAAQAVPSPREPNSSG